MADRDDDRFRPKLGRIRAKDGPAAQRLASRVVKVANVAGIQRVTGASRPKRAVSVSPRRCRRSAAEGSRLVGSKLVSESWIRSA